MSIFNCIKCSLPYNKFDKKPKSLPCGHIFCEKCVSSFIKEESNKIICQCPIDNIIHKNLNFFQIPVCIQLLQNIPVNYSIEQEKEISGYITELEIKIEIIQKQINSYKEVEQNVIDYYNEQIKKINQYYDLFNMEIQKKRNLILEELSNNFKEQNLKIEENRKLILNYTSKLDEILKNYEEISEVKNYDNFLKGKKKIENDLNTIISFINENIVNVSQNQNYPLFIEPTNILIPNNLLGQLKIINNINFNENENQINETIINDSLSDIGNATNIFNQNLFNEMKKLKTPNKQNNKPKTYFLLSENSLPYKFDFYMNGFISYNNNSKCINESEKISRKKNLTLKDDENSNCISQSDLLKRKNINNKNLKINNEKDIRKSLENKNNKEIKNVFYSKLNKEKNLKVEKSLPNKDEYISNESELNPKRNKKEIKKAILNKNLKNNNNEIKNKRRNKVKVFSPNTFKTYDRDINERIS
jgi:hypothetical protein